MKAIVLLLFLAGCAAVTPTTGEVMPAPGGWDAYCATHIVPECSKP